MAFPAALARLQGFLAPCHALVLHLTAPCHSRLEAFPCPPRGPLSPGLDLAPLRPMPGPLPHPPPPFTRMVCARIGRGIPQGEGVAHLGGPLPHAVQHLRAPPPPCWSVLPFALPPRPRPWRGLLHRRPPGCAGIHEAIAGLPRAPTGEAQPCAVFRHAPTGHRLLVHAPGVLTRPRSAAREAAPGDGTDGPGGCPSAPHACEAGRGRGVLGFFAIGAHMAAVSARFFGGVALTTLRTRKPLRGSPSARGLGEGRGSALEPGAATASRAAWAGSRVAARVGRHVGACGAWAAASGRRPAAPSGGGAAQRVRPLQAAWAPVCRPHPKPGAARRGCPWQDGKGIAAGQARRVGPVIWEAARRKAAMGDARSGGSQASGVLRRALYALRKRWGFTSGEARGAGAC